MYKVSVLSRVKNSFIKHKKRFIALMVILFFVGLFFLFLRVSINPVILDTIEIKSKSLATRAMNRAIADVVMNSIVFDDLINIVTDEFGNISMIQANALEINNLSKDLAQSTERKIDEYGDNGVYIPLGSFTGIPILVGRGPEIKLKVDPVGAVNCIFSSRFETAGINQTNHKIYLKITAAIGVVIPLISVKYLAEQQVLISESIIVGQVPEVYLYSDNLDNLLNFVPY